MYYFRNPSNGYVEASSGSFSWLYALLWLEFYLLAKGNFRHFVMLFFLNLNLGSVYFLLFWDSDSFYWDSDNFYFVLLALRVVYALIIGQINTVHYLRQGWIEVADPVQQPPVHQPPPPQVQQAQRAEPETTSSSSA